MNKIPALFVILALSAPAASASGPVAVAIQLPTKDPVHRDFVAGVIEVLHERFEARLLRPAEVQSCQAKEPCLRKVALAEGAEHLIFVGVNELTSSDFVAVLRVSTTAGKDLFEYGDIETPGKDPRDRGRIVARKTFDDPKSSSLPKRSSPRPTPTAPLNPYSGLTPVSTTGWALVGVGGTLFVTGALWSFVPQQLPEQFNGTEVKNALDVAIVTGIIGGTMLTAGFLTVGVDALLAE